MIDFALAGGIFALDNRIKDYVNSNILQGTKKEVLSGKLILRNCHNKGSALNIGKMSEEDARELAALVLGGVAWEFARQVMKEHNKGAKIGISLVFGGGLSNYMDRRNLGYVTDYLSFGVNNKKLKSIVFNLSDVAIAGGAAIWLASVLLPSGKK